MQRLIMDMPLMISAALRHAADHHGKTGVMALAIEGDIHRYDHATARAHAAAGPTPCRVWACNLEAAFSAPP